MINNHLQNQKLINKQKMHNWKKKHQIHWKSNQMTFFLLNTIYNDFKISQTKQCGTLTFWNTKHKYNKNLTFLYAKCQLQNRFSMIVHKYKTEDNNLQCILY